MLAGQLYVWLDSCMSGWPGWAQHCLALGSVWMCSIVGTITTDFHLTQT